MPDNDNDIKNNEPTPTELLLDEIKKLRADNDNLKKELGEVKEFALANIRRNISGEGDKEPDNEEALNEIVEYYKKGYK